MQREYFESEDRRRRIKLFDSLSQQTEEGRAKAADVRCTAANFPLHLLIASTDQVAAQRSGPAAPPEDTKARTERKK